MSNLDRISALDRRMKEIWQPIFDAQLETIRELTMQLEAAKSEIDMRHRTIRLLIKNIDEKNARLHELEGERQMPQPVFYDNGEVVKFSKSFSGRPWGKVTK